MALSVSMSMELSLRPLLLSALMPCSSSYREKRDSDPGIQFRNQAWNWNNAYNVEVKFSVG